MRILVEKIVGRSQVNQFEQFAHAFLRRRVPLRETVAA
jgi:hypothetical protein